MAPSLTPPSSSDAGTQQFELSVPPASIESYANIMSPCSQQRWDDALRFCEQELGESDFALIQRYRTPAELGAAIEEMMKKARESSVPRLLRHFKPKILQLQTFTFGLTVTIGASSLQTACLWGLVTLMLEVW